jgi:hypothetical protein
MTELAWADGVPRIPIVIRVKMAMNCCFIARFGAVHILSALYAEYSR